VRVWTGFNWLRVGPVVGFCENGDEPLGCQQAGNFLTSRAAVSSAVSLEG